MQLFVNNFSASLLAPLDASAAQLSIDPAQAAKLTGLVAGSYYLLTLAAVDGSGVETAWEVVKVTTVAGGVLTVERGLEGTIPADWPVAASVTARVTAGALAALSAQGGGSGSATIIGTDYPSAAPPAIGSTFIFDRAVFIGVGTAEPEQWTQMSGWPKSEGTSIQMGNQTSLSPGRMDRDLRINGYGGPGDSLAVVPVMMPAWRSEVEGMTLKVLPAVDGLVMPVALDFGSSWSFLEIYCSETSLFTPARSGNVISFSVSQGVMLRFVIQPYESEGVWSLYVEITAVAAPRLVPL